MRALIEAAHDEAWEILVEYRDVLDSLVLELMEKETLTKDDMARICAARCTSARRWRPTTASASGRRATGRRC